MHVLCYTKVQNVDHWSLDGCTISLSLRIHVRTETNIADEQTALLRVETVYWSRPDTVGHAVVNLVPSCNLGFIFFVRFSPNYPVSFLDVFQFPPASAAHCKAQLSIFAQVDDAGNAWVAGDTRSSLDGHTNANDDIFLMKFDAQGVHLWTRQRGGNDRARALQADGVRRCFSCDILWHFPRSKASEPFRGSMFRVMWSDITIEMDQSLVYLYKVWYLVSREVSRWKSERWILTKSTERDHVLNAWNLELTKKR